jgi:hypothetical protein
MSRQRSSTHPSCCRGKRSQAGQSKDSYLRQAAALLLAERTARRCVQRAGSCGAPGGCACGWVSLRSLQRPRHSRIAPTGSGWAEDVYKITYADKKVDLRELGRIGLFTVAEHWKAAKRTDEQEAIFSLLQSRLDDADERVRLQAAHFLFLLNDPRTEPAIAKLRTDTEKNRLANVPLQPLKTAWVVGPFPDGGKGLKQPHPPEQGAVDLSATYEAPSGARSWQTVTIDRMLDFKKTFGSCDDSSSYAYFRIESPRKQQMMLCRVLTTGCASGRTARFWTNETMRARCVSGHFRRVAAGSNDFLPRNNIDARALTHITAPHSQRRTAGKTRHRHIGRTLKPPRPTRRRAKSQPSFSRSTGWRRRVGDGAARNSFQPRASAARNVTLSI